MTEEIEIPLASTDKYEEALAKARFEYKENPCATEGEKKLLEIIFPELAESEDERIRKEMIDYFSQFKEDGIRGVDITPWIIYLEKQKDAETEIEKAYKNADKIQYEKGFEDGVASVKPVEWSDDFEENIRILLNDKLTWHSEDGSIATAVLIDNKQLKDIISGIWFYVGKEALKYPNKELNVSEWSEEDEDKVAQYLHDKDGGMLWSKATEIAEDILGMIRPKPHWKPSERQMRDLATLAKQNEGNSLGNDLISLYNDLKKL